MGNSRLRRLVTLCGAAALAAGSLLVSAAPAAHAATDPFPAGTTTWVSTGTFSFTVSGTATPVNFSGTLKGTSDGAGNITFPQSGVKFGTVDVTLLGQPATVQISPTSTWHGTINTTTGLTTLTGTLTTLINIPGLAQTACGLGPITPVLSSAKAGGVAYKKTGDTAT